MKILGLTGGIAMGKSATAGLFAEAGIPVYDADAAVHALYQAGGAAVAPVEAAFPGVTGQDGAIDRAKLRACVAQDADALKTLESVVHPLVGGVQMSALQAAQESGAPCFVLDVPLLFETGGNARCDYIATVTVAPEIQRERVLDRATMTEAEFEAILAKQMPDAEKRARSDFIINTGFGFQFARDQVRAIIDLMIRLGDGEQG
ncbi:MAG: dephospho-CoA kinase [Pseudomonadota bacterium]